MIKSKILNWLYLHFKYGKLSISLLMKLFTWQVNSYISITFSQILKLERTDQVIKNIPWKIIGVCRGTNRNQKSLSAGLQEQIYKDVKNKGDLWLLILKIKMRTLFQSTISGLRKRKLNTLDWFTYNFTFLSIKIDILHFWWLNIMEQNGLFHPSILSL